MEQVAVSEEELVAESRETMLGMGQAAASGVAV
jgi:hypothetical protein